jgi:F-type H+-transporting ATPase subunit epsilon
MSNPFTFELVSPEKLLFSGDVTMVTVPGEEGDFGVLHAHSPLISTLRPGVLRVYEGSEITQRVFISGGFAEVTGARCTVLADTAQLVSEIDPSQARQDFLHLDEQFHKETDAQERAILKKRREIARVKAEIAA